MTGRNEYIPMTRRYPNLKPKQLLRDSKIAKKIINAGDTDKNEQKLVDIFLKEKELLSHPRYWEILRSVWIVSGSTENAPIFSTLMQSKRPYRNYFMSPEDEKYFNDLPAEFVVYRACNIPDNGISWTLNKEYAESFKQQALKQTVLERVVSKSDCFAYINRNDEQEVLILIQKI